MLSKIVEIRDKNTFIPALCVQLGSDNDQERWLMSSAGYGREIEDQKAYVVLVKIAGGEPCDAHIDPFAWGQNLRTYHVAHNWIRDHFDEIEPGQVIDVQTILGETDTPKTSDRHYHGAAV